MDPAPLLATLMVLSTFRLARCMLVTSIWEATLRRSIEGLLTKDVWWATVVKMMRRLAEKKS